MTDSESFYYDSLDEDDKPAIPASIKKPVVRKNRSKEESKQSTVKTKAVSLIPKQSTAKPKAVPLIPKRTSAKKAVEEVKSLRTGKSTPALTVKKTKKSCGSTTNTSLSSVYLEPKVNERKSYVSLFYAKLGINSKPETVANNDPLTECESFKTAPSSQNSLEFSDAVSSTSDTESLFRKFTSDGSQSKRYSCSCCSTIDDDIGRSQYNAFRLTNTSLTTLYRGEKPSVHQKRIVRVCKQDRGFLKVPSLGGLGPDIESCRPKLEKLKRQQNYGQKVSNLNRMKMLESKVVKNFKLEMKKSSELNKCTENVLLS